VKQFFNGCLRDGDVLNMHDMLLHGGGFYRQESSGPYMKGDELLLNIFCRQGLENRSGEMQAGSGGCDRAIMAGIDGLVSFAVRLFCRSPDIRR